MGLGRSAYGLPRVLLQRESGGEEKGGRAKVPMSFPMLQEHGSSGGSSAHGSTPWDAGFTSFLTAFPACAGLDIRLASNFVLDLHFCWNRIIESQSGLCWKEP